MISENDFTCQKLWALLENNTITNFDPVKEAFRVYDPNGTGFVDVDVLKQIMSRMGYGEMSKDDVEVTPIAHSRARAHILHTHTHTHNRC